MAVDWKRAKDIFADVMEAPVAERAERLMDAVGPDEELRKVVDRLLAAHQTATGFLAEPPADDDVPELDSSPLTRVGPYSIQDVLGEGGFGIVYRAYQRSPIEREVALKVLKRGMDTDRVVRRFRAERDVLARMAHPGIATVLEAV